MSASLMDTFVAAVVSMRRAQRRRDLEDHSPASCAEARVAEHMVDKLVREIGRRTADPAM